MLELAAIDKVLLPSPWEVARIADAVAAAEPPSIDVEVSDEGVPVLESTPCFNNDCSNDFVNDSACMRRDEGVKIVNGIPCRGRLVVVVFISRCCCCCCCC